MLLTRFSANATALLWALVLLSPTLATADPNDWAEGTDGLDDGATRDFYNRGARLPWSQLLGDWHDRDGTLHGDVAWASGRVEDTDTGRFVEWDVTDLVRAWLDGSEPNQGVFLRATSGGGPIVFVSREGADAGQHPELVVTTTDSMTPIDADRDTRLVASTFRAQGSSDELRVGAEDNTLIHFDVSGFADVTSASLRVYTSRQFGGGLDIGVFSPAPGRDGPAPELELGFAAGFDQDAGIDGHADVVMFEDFEAADWTDHWTALGGTFDITDADPAFGFAVLAPDVGSRALRVLMPEAENASLNIRYDFMAETGAEPDEIYFRYYLRFGDDWNQTVDGGKLPGISGTYGTAGWGGRRSDGTNGWSARGLFRESVPRGGNPLGGRTPIGSYVYHADMPTRFGDNYLWVEGWGPEGYGGVIEPQRWVCLEHYVRMNTPGDNDGVLRAWVDGRRSLDIEDLRFRDVDRLRIERIWMNVYHGGTDVSPYDQHLFIDHVVIARSYIGPMGGLVPPPPPDAGVGTDAGPGVDGGSTPGDGGSAVDAGDAPPGDGGCGCRAGRSTPAAGWLCCVALVVLTGRRRRAG